MNIKINKNNIYISLESNYKDFENCVTLYLLLDQNGNIYKSCINDHSGIDECLFQKIEDGYYRVYSIIIPKYEYLPTDLNVLLKFDKQYYYKDECVYKYLFRKNELEDIDYTELLKDCNSNITTSYRDVFMYYTLEQSLISYIVASSDDDVKLQNLSAPQCSDCRNIPQSMTLEIRNKLSMILEMIKHSIKCNNFQRAQYLLKLVTKYCNVREIDS